MTEQELLEDESVAFFDTPAAAIIVADEDDSRSMIIAPDGTPIVAHWKIADELFKRFGPRLAPAPTERTAAARPAASL